MCNTTDSWPAGEIRRLRPEVLDERYARYRLPSAELDQAMVRSLHNYGQLSPIVVCRREERLVLIDGFKRLRASRRIEDMTTLFARRIDADEAAAKAAIYGLNQIGRRPCELEEAWIVHSLVREDGLPQLQVAEMLGRHKSWVCRRLALLEKLIEDARDDLRLGLLSVSAARQLIRLPAGNQAELMAAMRRRSLSATELEGVTDLLLASATVEQKQFILGDPRKALRQTGLDRARRRSLGRVTAFSSKTPQSTGCVRSNGPRLAGALEHAARHGAYSSTAVERILAIQATPRTALDRLAEREQGHLRWLMNDLPTRPRDTAEYQHLLEGQTSKGTPDGEDAAKDDTTIDAEETEDDRTDAPEQDP